MSEPSPESKLDEAITDVLARLSQLDPSTKEHASATDQLVKLYELKQENQKHHLEARTSATKHMLEQQAQSHQEALDSKPKPIDRNTLVLAGANLLGIVLIVGHERANVVTSKAIGFIKTLR